MIIKSSPVYAGIVVFLFCAAIAFSTLLFQMSESVVVFTISLLVLLVIIVRYWICVGRTFIMCAEGCTVQFLLYQRTYKWNEFETKQIEDYTNSFGYRQPYTAGAIFCEEKTHKPAWLMPMDYCFFTRPFRFVFVYFDPCIQHKKWDYYCPNIYVVDETAFRKKLIEWQVVLKGQGDG